MILVTGALPTTPAERSTSMLDPDVRRVLDGASLAHLATVLPDGSPHATPVYVGAPYPRGPERVVAVIEPERQAVGIR